MFEILWDIPDEQGDRENSIKTLPVVLGYSLTKKILIFANLLTLTLSRTNIPKFISLIILFFLLATKKNTDKKYYHIIVFFISLVYLVSGFLLFK